MAPILDDAPNGGPVSDVTVDETPRPEPEPESGDVVVASTAQIRAWARDNGFDVPTRGRLPQDVTDAYKAAHKDNTDD